MSVLWHSEIFLLKFRPNLGHKPGDSIIFASGCFGAWPFSVEAHLLSLGIKKVVSTKQEASLMAQMVKNLPAVQKTRVRSIGW